MEAIVLFSGGQDSCTTLSWAKRVHGADQVLALSVVYGQRHRIELDCAKVYAERAGVEHMIIDAEFFGSLAPSALTGEGSVSEPHPLIPEVPASFVPNRNAFMLTLAHSVAQGRGADRIYGGMCEADSSGYPDCRLEFIHTLIGALNIGSNVQVAMIAPLMHLSKAQTFAAAERIGVLDDVIEFSHTCYEGQRDTRHPWGYGCGVCPACLLREKGFNEYLINKEGLAK